MAHKDAQEQINQWDSIKNEIRSELDRNRQELSEVALMLEQSQLDVKKLAQRNASATASLQQMQSQIESLPRSEIRKVYESALDSQQRLFVMRGQLEKLQNDQVHLDRFIALMDRVLQLLQGDQPEEVPQKGSSKTVEIVEMIVQAQEAERQRLSRQMHDGPAQALSNFILQTEIALRLFEVDQSKAKEELANMKESATGAFQKVRDFIFELRPMMLDDLGLNPTLKRYVDAFKEQSGMDIRLTITGKDHRLASYQEVMIFRAIQELLNNAAHHSHAQQVKVQMDVGDMNVKIQVSDDGKGLDVEEMEAQGTMGLKVIRDRVEMLGGYFEVDSVVDQGTRVTFQIPTEKAEVSG
jgi:two-component system sensor histidine kinase DegS